VRKSQIETNSYTARAHGPLKVTLRLNSRDHVYQDHSLCQSLCKQLWPNLGIDCQYCNVQLYLQNQTQEVHLTK